MKVIVTRGGHVFESWAYQGGSEVARELSVHTTRTTYKDEHGIVWVIGFGRLIWDDRLQELYADGGHQPRIPHTVLQDFPVCPEPVEALRSAVLD